MTSPKLDLQDTIDLLSKPDRSYHLYKKGHHLSPCPGCQVLAVLRGLGQPRDAAAPEHKKSCKWVLAVSSSVGIECDCELKRDVCPVCDECTC